MKLSLPSLLCALAAGLAVAPAASRADYQPASFALNKLENIVTLSPAQEKQALKIFEDLKVVMDSMDPADRPMKGAQNRKDAVAAIRAILTPDQQAIEDRTPQRLGGGNAQGDPSIAGVQSEDSRLRDQPGPKLHGDRGAVGAVQKVQPLANGAVTQSNGDQPDPNMHPESGSNLVSVTGSNGTKTFKISWDMTPAGEMTVSKVEAAAN